MNSVALPQSALLAATGGTSPLSSSVKVRCRLSVDLYKL